MTRATPRATLTAIHRALSGQTWTADTCTEIAQLLHAAGFTVSDVPDAPTPDDDTRPAACTCNLCRRVPR